ncbi:MAG TPA: glycosyltransferase [Chthoniobacterales bacterium]|jgi:GT2 family glycosyltransferase
MSQRTSPVFVVAVIPTYLRQTELDRLLRSLERCGAALGAVVIIDNGNEEAIRELALNRKKEVIYEAAPANAGPGAAWKRGTELAFERFAERLTHILTLDDDVIIERESLEELLRGLELSDARAAAPLICDELETAGALAVPEPLHPRLRRVIREVRTRADAARLLGPEPVEIAWCIGPCLLLTREAIQKAGLHRDDFFMLGEDVEYSLRVGSSVKMVAIPWVFVPHLPPPPLPDGTSRERDYMKFCALLQNLTYIALRLPRTRHLWRYLPGNFRRFFRTFGWSGETMGDAWECFSNGFLLAQPAGRERFTAFRTRLAKRSKTAVSTH